MPAPNRLTVFERQVYWTDSTRQGVIRIDKFNGTDTLASLFGYSQSVKTPKAVKAVHRLLQPSGQLQIQILLCEYNLSINFPI